MGSETEEKATNSVSTQLATLVPSFDPSKDDLEQYAQKIEMLADVWPSDKLNELATRLILNSTGAAFQKLQLQKSVILTGTKAGIQSIVTILGGQWGKVNLEKKYETVEKALFRCTQRGDETNDSYLARTDIYWTELLSKKTSLEEIQAYVVLRGSLLSQEDKKKVILESDAAGKGVLAIDKVNQSVRMLGSGFFHEMVGLKKSKGKVYDATALFSEETDEAEGTAFTMEDPSEEEMLEMLLQEGDEDAAFICDYETAITEAIQDDPELASALNAYTEARKRLSDRAKNRGFWPLGNSKGRGKGFKGRGKGAFKGARKSLQQRIMESSCRICGKRGHWKAECPDRPRSSGSAAPSTAATMTTMIESAPAETIDELLPLEFMQLPVASEATLDEEPNQQVASAFTMIFRGKKYYNLGNPRKENKMSGVDNNRLSGKHDIAELRNECPVRESIRRFPVSKALPKANQVHLAHDEMALFATHGSFGILDTGATKSVIGSALVPELLRSLHPKVRDKVQRCKCRVTFRFGNQGLLDSNHAIVIPIGNLGLKIAVVQGHTPLLLSNTLLRALKSSIDVNSSSLHSPVFGKPIKMQLNSRGLFLVDLNELVQSALKLSTAAETFANCDNVEAASENKQDPSERSGNLNQISHATPMPIPCHTPHKSFTGESPPQKTVSFNFMTQIHRSRLPNSLMRSMRNKSQSPIANRLVQVTHRSSHLISVPTPKMSLADRFERALERSQTYAQGDSMEEFKSLSFEEKCQQTVTFGKTHVGRNFLDMYHNEPKWMKWFLRTYESSQKLDHMKLRHFVQIMLEQEEKGETLPTLAMTEPALQMPMFAKAKARPRDQAPVHHLPEEMNQHQAMQPDADDWSLASMAPEPNEMITALQARMGHMENAMTEVLNHIRQN